MFNEPTDPYEDADREDDEFCDGRGRFDHDEKGRVIDRYAHINKTNAFEWDEEYDCPVLDIGDDS